MSHTLCTIAVLASTSPGWRVVGGLGIGGLATANADSGETN